MRICWEAVGPDQAQSVRYYGIGAANWTKANLPAEART